jgi:hypothetical protein
MARSVLLLGLARPDGHLPSSIGRSHVASDGSGAPVGVTSGRVVTDLPDTHVTPSGFPRRENSPNVTDDAGALLEQSCRSGAGHSGQVGRAAPVDPPPVGPHDRLQCPADVGHVPVVDAAVVQLTGELAEQPAPPLGTCLRNSALAARV